MTASLSNDADSGIFSLVTAQSSEGEPARGLGARTALAQLAVIFTASALVIAVYVGSVRSGASEQSVGGAQAHYYNLLVQGFRAGRLNVNKPVPHELARMDVPGDPAAKASDRYPLQDTTWVRLHSLHDLSYYRGNLYLYFGVTPALLLFWPAHELTGHYLPHRAAVLVFCVVGFLAGAGLVWALWRRDFADVSVGMMGLGILAVGLCAFAPGLLSCAEVYEVSISCGQALLMVALGALCCALHHRARRVWWLVWASLAGGLALGARPSLFLGSFILIVPVAQVLRDQQRLWPLLLAATGPIVLIGLALMVYNALRFDNPIDFGQRYQLPVSAHKQFSLAFLWFNLRVGLLEPAGWGIRFPFVRDLAVPPIPRGYFDVGHVFGLLSNVPFVWVALAAPLGWRGRAGEDRVGLRGLFVAVALLFGASALVLGLHDSMHIRYQVEYAFPLVLLAVVGIWGLERAWTGRAAWRGATRCGWGVLLVLSVGFNLLARSVLYAETFYGLGFIALEGGQETRAMACFQKALALQPDFAVAHNGLGALLIQQGRVAEAIRHFEQALRLDPDDAQAHYNLGGALFRQGRPRDAIAHYEHALRIKPDFPEAHHKLGTALLHQDRVVEALKHLEQALRLQPDFPEAHYNLATALIQQGRPADAVAHLEQALRLRPEDADARNNLAVALIQLGERSAAQGKWQDAIGQYERAIQMKPYNAQAYDSLGAALSRLGRYAEAVRAAQTGLDLAQRAGQGELARQIQERLRLYQNGQPYRDGMGGSR